jgi:general secretion pathway protein I
LRELTVSRHAALAGNPGRRGRQRGFSLLEVVVAFAILALSLGVLIQVFSRALNTTALSGTYSRAATLAEARLNSVGIEIPLEPGSYSGEPESGFSWRVFIEPYEIEDSAWESVVESFRVTSVASWGEGSEEGRQVSLSTMRLASPSDLRGLGAPASGESPNSSQTWAGQGKRDP